MAAACTRTGASLSSEPARMASSELIVSFSSPSAARHRTRPARSTAVLGLGPIAEETRGVDATAREAVARGVKGAMITDLPFGPAGGR